MRKTIVEYNVQIERDGVVDEVLIVVDEDQAFDLLTDERATHIVTVRREDTPQIFNREFCGVIVERVASCYYNLRKYSGACDPEEVYSDKAIHETARTALNVASQMAQE